MSSMFDGTNDVWDERLLKARKAHKCTACGETIAKGHRYWRAGALFDGQWNTHKRCLRCKAIFDHLVARVVTTGMYLDEGIAVDLDCGQDYQDAWGEDPPPEIAALAFVTQDEMQERKT